MLHSHVKEPGTLHDEISSPVKIGLSFHTIWRHPQGDNEAPGRVSSGGRSPMCDWLITCHHYPLVMTHIATYWKWPFVVNCPSKSGDFHSYVTNYQRVFITKVASWVVTCDNYGYWNVLSQFLSGVTSISFDVVFYFQWRSMGWSSSSENDVLLDTRDED